MTFSYTENQQDTVRLGKYLLKESVKLKTFSLPAVRQFSLKDTGKQALPASARANIPFLFDTTTVCLRNSIADVTFYYPDNIVFKVTPESFKEFPLLFTDKVRMYQMDEKALLTKQLKSGNDLPDHYLHNDWMILIILFAAFLHAVVRTSYKNVSHSFARFFLFRGINDPGSRDIGGLFHWQSTILNLISFLIIGLFVYSAASYFNLIPSGFKGIVFWLISLAVICCAITLRHITCVITGSASGQEEVFREYLVSIYQTYRFGALFLAAIILAMSYTNILPAGNFIIAGIIIAGLMYLLRIIRLLIIFLNRNISIFYLILYLCALEILPVLIVVKYFTGLA